MSIATHFAVALQNTPRQSCSTSSWHRAGAPTTSAPHYYCPPKAFRKPYLHFQGLRCLHCAAECDTFLAPPGFGIGAMSRRPSARTKRCITTFLAGFGLVVDMYDFTVINLAKVRRCAPRGVAAARGCVLALRVRLLQTLTRCAASLAARHAAAARAIARRDDADGERNDHGGLARRRGDWSGALHAALRPRLLRGAC